MNDNNLIFSIFRYYFNFIKNNFKTHTMNKDKVFNVTTTIDLEKDAFFSLIDSDLKEQGTVVIKDEMINVYLKNKDERKFESNFNKLKEFVKERGYTFVELDEESRWEEFNPNPLGKNVDDCSIRSYCAAKGIEWDTAFDYACEIAEAEKDIINSTAVCDKVITQKLKMVLNKESKKVKPKNRPTVMEFACTHPEGIYILNCSKHSVCVKDGYIYDSWNSSQLKVKCFYEIPDESYTPEE